MSDAFRAASEPTSVEPAQPQAPAEDKGSPLKTEVDGLLATYQDDKGKPYIANYLGVDNVWDSVTDMRNELNTIEGFLRERVTKGELENSTKAAKKYLSELEKKAETNSYESTTKRIQKLLAYIEFKKVIES